MGVGVTQQAFILPFDSKGRRDLKGAGLHTLMIPFLHWTVAPAWRAPPTMCDEPMCALKRALLTL